MRLFLLVWSLSLLGWAQPQRHLVIVGGGDHPPAAMTQLHRWAGQEKARLLVIPWATSEPKENFQEVAKDFAASPTPPHMELAPLAPLDASSRALFLEQLKTSTGVWFSGGDQVKVMDVLKDRELLQALRDKYEDGTVFGGTSAGCAIMSIRMLTGETDLTLLDGRQVEIQEGLGLLPRHVIVDQHFNKRQRQNRLFGLVLENPDSIGVGIDEDTALLVSNDREARVVGRSQVMLVYPQKTPNSLLIRLYKSGDQLDLGVVSGD